MNRVVVLGDVMVKVVARLEEPVASGSHAPARIELHGAPPPSRVLRRAAKCGAPGAR